MKNQTNETNYNDKYVLEMEEHDYAITGKMVSDLLDDIGANDSQNDIFDIIENAVKVDPNGIEVNGDKFERIEDGKVVVYDYPEERHIARQDIDWIRVEGYGGKPEYDGAYIMYVYLHLNRSRSVIDRDNIQFDYYPSPDTDEYVDSVNYKDCLKHMNESSPTMSNARAQVDDFLEKIGDYLMVDFDVEDVEKYKYGPRIYFEKDGVRYFVEVGLSDNQPN